MIFSPRTQEFLRELQQREQQFHRTLASDPSFTNHIKAQAVKTHARSDATYANHHGVGSIRDEIREDLNWIVDAFEDYRNSRRRDAIYWYLGAVYRVVTRFRGRRRTGRLMQRASVFASFPYDQKADPFSTIIRATTAKMIDVRTRSKWSRALRYAAYRKRAPRQLKSFMKKRGGINACADRYAKLLGRGRRRR